jgi:transcriptional regulator with XRE-family HTH domain
MSLADTLKALRYRAGLTQHALAQQLDMTAAAISSVESGRRSISLEKLTAWSSACGGATIIADGAVLGVERDDLALVSAILKADAETRTAVREMLEVIRNEGPGSTVLLELRVLIRTLARR